MDIPGEAFSTPIQIRFVDTDLAGHVNHATFISFLETARINWIKEEGADSVMTTVPIIIARVEIDYKAPITLYDEPVVSTWISRLGSKSFDMDYAIHGLRDNQKIMFATAKTVIVYYNYEKHQSEEIPQDLRVLFEKFQPKN
jgi:acyl-CoA thioester hydrolase